MSSLRILVAALATTALIALAGCDFHEEQPPVEGTYSSRFLLLAPKGGAGIDVLTAGGKLEIRLQNTNGDRRAEVDIEIPDSTLFPDQERVDTTLTGSFTVIVDQVNLKFQRTTTLLPTKWAHQPGTLRASGSVEIEDTEATMLAELQK